MNWFNGSITDAVAKCKTKNAIFVVFIEGKDESTEKLSKFLNEPTIKGKLETDDFVAIKIHSDSEAYLQFASIYQIVPVPSVFFIGKSGTPLDVATSVTNTAEELITQIQKVLEMAGKSSEWTSQMSIECNNKNGEENKAMEMPVGVLQENNVQNCDTSVDNEAIICDGTVCSKKPPTPKVEENVKSLQNIEVDSEKNDNTNVPITSVPVSASTPTPTSTVIVASAVVEDNTDEKNTAEKKKLEETRKYLEQKRRERIEEEQRIEKESELKRRQEGKVIQNLRQWQHEQEFKELKDSIKREKMEERAARERIRAQIAADKAERAQKFARTTTTTTSGGTTIASGNQTVGGGVTTSAATEMRTTGTGETRLQFRFGNGSSKNHIFQYTTTLIEVRDYVRNELLLDTGIKDFILATTYPKREFSDEHNKMSLLDLGLTPSAVILVLGIGNSANGPTSVITRSGSLFNMLTSVVWTILNPIIAAAVTARNWLQDRFSRGAGYADSRTTSGAQKRANEENNIQNDLAKRRNIDVFMNAPGPSTSNRNNMNNSKINKDSDTAYRRYLGNSNVHRLSDNRKDSDDENATWNGNSTQQQ